MAEKAHKRKIAQRQAAASEPRSARRRRALSEAADESGPRARERREESEAATPAPPAAAERTFVHKRRVRWVAAALAPLVLVLLSFGLDRALHAGEVLRGVAVAGIELGGMDRHAVERALLKLDADRKGTPLRFTLSGRAFELEPEDVKLRLDADAIADAALRAGRQGGIAAQLGFWLARLFRTHELDPVATVDRDALGARVDSWAGEAIDDPPFEGAVVVERGKPVGKNPRPGRIVDRSRAEQMVVDAYAQGAIGVATLPVVERAPERDAGAVSVALARARVILSGPVALVAERPDDAQLEVLGKMAAAKGAARRVVVVQESGQNKASKSEEERTARFELSAALLGRALRSRPAEGARLALELDPKALEPIVSEARAALERPALDASFAISPTDEITVRPSQRARILDPERFAARVLEVALSDAREGTLEVELGAEPGLATEDAKALGIKGLVTQFTTRHPCCRPRVKNIHRMAELVDGVLLMPGERFSLNEHVGQRTKKNGFFPAPTIVRGKMKDTFGGGVSQFATTFFNAFFHGGYEIVERQPHSFYFPRYPMGHEATLSYPKPDVIVGNDTEAGLLIRCVYSSTTITVKLYGDNGGRTVSRKVSAPQDLTDPPVEYIPDRKLHPDKKKVKERGQKGWTLIVARVVHYPDGKEKTEQRKVIYSPRPRRVRVHPCRIPKGEKGHTGEPCPEPEEDEDEEESDPAPAGPDELETATPLDPELTPEG